MAHMYSSRITMRFAYFCSISDLPPWHQQCSLRHGSTMLMIYSDVCTHRLQAPFPLMAEGCPWIQGWACQQLLQQSKSCLALLCQYSYHWSCRLCGRDIGALPTSTCLWKVNAPAEWPADKQISF